MTQRRWNSFDCLKGFACLAIVLVHYYNDAAGPWLEAVKATMRFAVPVFFAISGFFLLSDGRVDDAKVVGKIRHLLCLAAWSGVLCALYIVLSNMVFHPEWTISGYIAETITGDKVIKFLLQNEPFVYSHLWFIFALIDCYLVMLIFFSGTRNRTWMYVLAPVLLAAYTFMQEWRTFLGWPRTFTFTGMTNSITTHSLFFFRALPLFLFGVILREQQEKITRLHISRTMLLILAIAGAAIAVAERLFIANTQYFMGSYVSVAAMLILCVKEPHMHHPVLQYIGRNLSMYVYVIHIIVLQVLDGIASKVGIGELPLYAYGKLPLTMLLSLLLAQLIHQTVTWLRTRRVPMQRSA